MKKTIVSKRFQKWILKQREGSVWNVHGIANKLWSNKEFFVEHDLNQSTTTLMDIEDMVREIID